jgi:hypothetical protein
MSVVWFWIKIILYIIAGVVAIAQLPSALKVISGWMQRIQNWWALRSHKATVNRLAKLERALQSIDVLPVMDEWQSTFYTAVLSILALISAGLLSVTLSALMLLDYFAVPAMRPPFLTMASVVFILGVLVAMLTAHYFQRFSPTLRASQRISIEKGIKALKRKLEATANRISKN